MAVLAANTVYLQVTNNSANEVIKKGLVANYNLGRSFAYQPSINTLTGVCKPYLIRALYMLLVRIARGKKKSPIGK